MIAVAAGDLVWQQMTSPHEQSMTLLNTFTTDHTAHRIAMEECWKDG